MQYVSTGDVMMCRMLLLRGVAYGCEMEVCGVCACGMVVRGRSRVSVGDCVAMHVCCCTERGMSLVVRRPHMQHDDGRAVAVVV